MEVTRSVVVSSESDQSNVHNFMAFASFVCVVEALVSSIFGCS